MSTSVLRRYTPPTCTLEIAATGSVLSRWTDRTVLKNLRFHLRFDDPKLPEEQQTAITGDRLQLEALCEAVEAYIQSLLNQAPEQFSVLLAKLDSDSEPGKPSVAKMPIAGSKASELPSINASAAGIYLKPRGLLSHDLCLGSLNSEKPGSVVHLSALQLFDLANALDEYHAEALALPALGRPAWLKAPAGWAKVAAALVLAIGATGAVTKFVLDISAPVAQVESSEQEVAVSAPTASPTPLPSSGVPPSELQLKPLFPPKPPAGAMQPVPVPSDQGNLPPTGVTTAPPASTNPNPSATASQPTAVTVDPAASSQVAILPAPEQRASPPGAQTPLVFADTPPADLAASSSAAISPRVAESGRLSSSSIPAEPTSPDAAIGGEAPQLATNNSTAFDSYPQIAEVRDYFFQKWQPPNELTQILEYRLVLGADGTIQRIIPLGDASERFIDRTNMPLMGESFVSPLQDREQLQVRLVLSPDGKVQTFSDGN